MMNHPAAPSVRRTGAQVKAILPLAPADLPHGSLTRACKIILRVIPEIARIIEHDLLVLGQHESLSDHLLDPLVVEIEIFLL